MANNGRDERMNRASGEVSSDDRLVVFLSVLMRDHLTAGIVEKILEDHCKFEGTCYFDNGWIAEHAKDIAKRLRSKDGEDTEGRCTQSEAR